MGRKDTCALYWGGGGGVVALGGKLVSMMRSRKNREPCCLGYKSHGTISAPFSSPVQGLGSIAVFA